MSRTGIISQKQVVRFELKKAAAEKILGIVFALVAALKAWDLEAFAFQIRYYHVLEDPGLLWAAVGAVPGRRCSGWPWWPVCG